MRKIVFYGAMSLDGYLADKKDDLQWLLDSDLGYEDFEKQVSTFVMGRKTFEVAQHIICDKALYAGKEKVIFSRKKLSNKMLLAFWATL